MSRSISAGRLCFLRFRRRPDRVDPAAADLAPAPEAPASDASADLQRKSAPSAGSKAGLFSGAVQGSDAAAAARQAMFLEWCLRLMS